MKKIIFVVLLISLFFLSLPIVLIKAGDPSDQSWCEEISEKDRTGGLVPCGRSCGDPTTAEDEAAPCTLCHFFVMIDRWIKNLLFIFVPALAALMIAIGGFMYVVAYLSPAEMLTGGQKGGPKLLSQAKSLFTSVVFGLLIIYGSFLFVGIFLKAIGLADWTTNIYQNWWKEGFFEINCD